MLSASDTLKHWPGFRGEGGDDKEWDGADGGTRVIRNGMGPINCREFDLDTKVNQYNKTTQSNKSGEFKRDKSDLGSNPVTPSICVS